MSYTRTTVDRSCGETISTTTESVSINRHTMEVHVTPNAGEIVVAILPPRDPRGVGGFGGASIALSPEQARALAERLLATADQPN
jgi:hypothetical protein